MRSFFLIGILLLTVRLLAAPSLGMAAGENRTYVVFTRTQKEAAQAAKLGRVVRQSDGVTIIKAASAPANSAGLQVQEVDQHLYVGPYSFDPAQGVPAVPAALRSAGPAAGRPGFYLVQFDGPPSNGQIHKLNVNGVQVIQYVPSNAYLVKARPAALERAAVAAGARWSGVVQPAYKVSPELGWAVGLPVRATQAARQRYVVGLYANGDVEGTVKEIQALGGVVESVVQPGHLYLKVASVVLNTRKVEAVARLEGVGSIEPFAAPVQQDEVANQILAGNYTNADDPTRTGTDVQFPGYQSFLDSIPTFGGGTIDGSGVTVGVVDDGMDPTAYPIGGGFGGGKVAAFNTIEGVNVRRGALAVPTPPGTVTPPTPEPAWGHGHFCAGLIAGNPNAFGLADLDSNGFVLGQGVAPNADLIDLPVFRMNYGGDLMGLKAHKDIVETRGFDSGFNDFGVIANDSWNQANTQSTSYGAIEASYDAIVMDASPGDATTAIPGRAGAQPLTVVFSGSDQGAGGGGGARGFFRPSTAKNIITVGATQNYRINPAPAQGLDISAFATYTDRGPVPYETNPFVTAVNERRIKPDLVAPGDWVISGNSGPPNFGQPIDQLHRYGRSTSFAAAHVSGAAALLTQWWRQRQGANPSPALVKALLVNQAVNLQDFSGGGLGYGPREGWGRVRLDNIFEPDQPASRLGADYNDQNTTFTAINQPATRNYVVADPTKPVHVTLVWTDPPAPVNTTYPISDLTNDLDLSVQFTGATGTQTFQGNVFNANGFSVAGGAADRRNNVEQVVLNPNLPNGRTGSFTVNVNAVRLTADGDLTTGMPLAGGGTPDQHYALVVYNARLAPAAGDFDLQVTPAAPATLQVPKPNPAPNTRSFTIQTIPYNNLAGPIVFTTVPANPVPGAAGFTFSPGAVTTGGVRTATLDVTPSAATPLGVYPFDIVATDQATGVSHSQSVAVRVTNFGFGTACRTEPGSGLAIPDNNPAWTESLLNFTDDINIQDIEVTVDVSHPFIGDLEVQVESPDGTRVLLHDQTGEGTADIQTSYPTVTTPVEPLSAFFGKRSQGIWKLRVRDLNPGDIGTINQFCLRIDGPDFPRVQVTFPNGGERLHIGSAQTIRWKNDPTNPLTGDVNVELSRDNGANWTILTTVPVDVEQYTFTLTGPPTTQALVRVSLVADPIQQSDVSDATFSILNPFISVIQPNGGEQIPTTQPYQIQWDAVPMLAGETVKIDLSIDGGNSFPFVLAASAPNTGTFSWTPQVNQITSQARIRVTANSAPARTDTSDANFTILSPGITVTEPNGGDLWYISTPRQVKFTAQGVSGLVRVELSRLPARTDWTTLGIIPASQGVLNVPAVTGPVTSTALVRVTSIDDPLKADLSDNTFEIRDIKFTVTDPKATDRWAIGTTYDIKWTSEGLPTTPAGANNVDIQISRDGGPFTTLFSDIPDDGIESWLVTAPETTNAVIRVKSHNFTGSGDSASFQVLKPFTAIITPNGGERVAVGRPFEIKWDAVPPTGTVTIRLSTDSGATFPTVITANAPNNGSFFWTPLPGQDTTTARIQISVNGDPFPDRTDVSAADFTIETPTISVTEPAAGDVWYIGTTRPIRYQTVGLAGGVNIDVRRGNGPLERIFSNVPTDSNVSANVQNWVVTGPKTQKAVIRVTSVVDPTRFAESSEFEIRPITITVVRPNGGEVWGVGTTHAIQWTTEGLPSANSTVDIAISTNGGQTFTNLFTNVASTNGPVPNTQSFTVPNTLALTNQAVIKIKSSVLPDFDVSDAAFTIASAGITVLNPAAGEQLRIGLPFTVRWASTGLGADDGTSGNVMIELRRTPSSAWETIVGSTPNNGSYTFTVTGPETTGATAQVRITSLSVSTAVGVSPSVEIITPTITVTRPNNGEKFFIGEPQSITWDFKGFDGNVKIELSRDGGANWSTLFPSTANDGSEEIIVTGPESTNARVRVSSVALRTDGITPIASDTSDGPFTIVSPTIRVGTPNGGQEFLVGSTATVTWTSQGVTSGVNIDLVYTDGTTVRVASNTANDGTHSFTVPGPAATGVVVRVSWAANPSIVDESDSGITFSDPDLTVTSPNQSTKKVRVGDRLTITWEGSVVRSGGGTVDVFISRNGGNTFTEKIISDTANDGTVSWTVTKKLTNKAKIKVVWNPDTSIQDTSDGVFKIIAAAKANRR